MKAKLQAVVDKVRSNLPNYEKLDEYGIRNHLVTRILEVLGWDRYDPDEFYLEYPVDAMAVDYCLRDVTRKKEKDKNRVFVEAKRIKEKFSSSDQEQILGYAFKKGVELTVLTTGVEWWFYLSFEKGDWKERKFCTVNLITEDPDDIAANFIEFLSKENVLSGEAVKNAKEYHSNKQREREVMDTLPKAWGALISGTDDNYDFLVEMLVEITEGMCEHRPSEDVVRDFLVSVASGEEWIEEPPKEPVVSTWKKPVSFTFKGVANKTKTWNEVIQGLYRVIAEEQGGNFKKILTLRAQNADRAYFTTDPDDGTFRKPAPIPNTDVYAEGGFSPYLKQRVIDKVLDLFGYSPDDFSVELKEMGGGVQEPKEKKVVHAIPHWLDLKKIIEKGIIQAPLEIENTYDGVRTIAAVNSDGTITFDDKTYTSLSIAGRDVKTKLRGTLPDGSPQHGPNGWRFWKYKDSDGELKEMDSLRKLYLEKYPTKEG